MVTKSRKTKTKNYKKFGDSTASVSGGKNTVYCPSKGKYKKVGKRKRK